MSCGRPQSRLSTSLQGIYAATGSEAPQSALGIAQSGHDWIGTLQLLNAHRGASTHAGDSHVDVYTLHICVLDTEGILGSPDANKDCKQIHYASLYGQPPLWGKLCLPLPKICESIRRWQQIVASILDAQQSKMEAHHCDAGFIACQVAGVLD